MTTTTTTTSTATNEAHEKYYEGHDNTETANKTTSRNGYSTTTNDGDGMIDWVVSNVAAPTLEGP